MDSTASVFVEDDDVFVDSGDQGILGREVELVCADGLKHLNPDGLTIVVVEHGIAFVRQVSQRAYVPDKATVVATLERDELASTERGCRVPCGVGIVRTLTGSGSDRRQPGTRRRWRTFESREERPRWK